MTLSKYTPLQTHALKVKAQHWSKYEEDISWSVRNNNRCFREGDICIFHKVDRKKEDTWDVRLIKQIEQVHYAIPGLDPAYVILDLQLIKIVRGRCERNISPEAEG